MATVTSFIHAKWNKWDNKWNYYIFSVDMTEHEYVLLETREIEFESPSDLMLRHQLVRVLQGVKKDVQARAQVQLNDLDQRIQELLAIEDKSGREAA